MRKIYILVYLMYLSSAWSRLSEEQIEFNPCAPCGVNAICDQTEDAGACLCSEGYQGNPYVHCRPECLQSSDCSEDKSCIQNKCVDPCSDKGRCRPNTECTVINHSLTCVNKDHTTIGNRYKNNPKKKPKQSDPCETNPCGINGECQPINKTASCSCIQGYVGSPPNCHPGCLENTDCPPNQACVAEMCRYRCGRFCGLGAVCHMQTHRPICTCPDGYYGNPYTKCLENIEEEPVTQHSTAISTEATKIEKHKKNTEIEEPKIETNKSHTPELPEVTDDFYKVTNFPIRSREDDDVKKGSFNLSVILISNFVTVIITTIIVLFLVKVYMNRRAKRTDSNQLLALQPSKGGTEPVYEQVNYSSAGNEAVIDIVNRPAYPLPQESEEVKKYVHYSTPYEERIFEWGKRLCPRQQRT